MEEQIATTFLQLQSATHDNVVILNIEEISNINIDEDGEGTEVTMKNGNRYNIKERISVIKTLLTNYSSILTLKQSYT